MTRPSTGASGLGIVGKPATASSSRGRTQTGMRSAKSDSFDALTNKLILQMREKFSASSLADQEIISKEVMSFMVSSKPTNMANISELENRITSRFSGEAQPPRAKSLARATYVDDEWSSISSYQVNLNAQEEDKKKAFAAERKIKMKADLNAQICDKKTKLDVEKNKAALFHEEEMKSIKTWESAEQKKNEQRLVAQMKLKKERDDQLRDKERRRQNQLNLIKENENKEKLQIQLEHVEKKKAEEDARNKVRSEMAALLASNEENKRVRDAAKAEQVNLDLEYQRRYAILLDKQEAARKNQFVKLKEKQASTKTNDEYASPSKRWMPSDVIERNAEKLEAQNLAIDEQRKRAVKDRNDEMRMVLAVQLEEKKARIKKEQEAEDQRAQALKVEQDKLEAEKEAEKVKKHARMVKHRMELDQQIMENAKMKKVNCMSDTERKLNKNLLSKCGL